MKVTLNKSQVDQVVAALKDLGQNADKQIKIAIGKTAEQVKIRSARKLRQSLQVPVKVLKKAIRIKRPKETDGLSATIILAYGYPIPLKYFGAKQATRTKKGVKRKIGVTFKIEPRMKNRQILRDAFIVERYKGHVYRRTTSSRGPIIRMHGPAPGDYYESGGVTAVALQTANDELPKQINERLRFLIVKAQNRLRGKK
jgi:hypothetical protein